MGSTGQRYAKALIESVPAAGDLQRAKEDFKSFLETLDASKELKFVFMNPSVSRKTAKAVLEEVLEKGSGEIFRKFIGVVIDNGRQKIIYEIKNDFDRLCDEAADIMKVTVKSAVPLSPDQEKRLKEKLSLATGKDVIVENIIEASVIGGCTVTVRDTVVDGSVKNYLNKMQEALANA
ncbi:MAG: ATP synthase F1 subunit delta [Candidatus Saganbacteria bacterium]|nr:ATP synthase F1 subunit delta [Candidatus Saganbacteria bacterium]